MAVRAFGAEERAPGLFPGKEERNTGSFFRQQERTIESLSEKDDIEQKLKELNQTKKALSTLISSLDNKRIEQMAYTFKQMMKNFQTTFEKIVPMGRGQLEVVGGPDEGSEVEKFTEATGIQVKVTFTGKVYSA